MQLHVHPQAPLVHESRLADVALVRRVLVPLHMMPKVALRHSPVAETARCVLRVVRIQVRTDVIFVFFDRFKVNSAVTAIFVIRCHEWNSFLGHHAAVFPQALLSENFHATLWKIGMFLLFNNFFI